MEESKKNRIEKKPFENGRNFVPSIKKLIIKKLGT